MKFSCWMSEFAFLFVNCYLLTDTFMSLCRVIKEANWKPIRQVHTDRCRALMPPHANRSIEIDALLQDSVLKENVEEKCWRKLVETHAATPIRLISGLSVLRTFAVMMSRVLFSTNILERCIKFTRTIARVQFLLNWDVAVLLVVLQLQGRNEGGNEGTIPRAPNHYGCAEKSQQCKDFLQNSKFASEIPQVRTCGRQTSSYPWRHLTSLRPCANGMFVADNIIYATVTCVFCTTTHINHAL